MGKGARIDELINKMEQRLFFRRSGSTIHDLATNFDLTLFNQTVLASLGIDNTVFIGRKLATMIKEIRKGRYQTLSRNVCFKHFCLN